MAADYLDGLLFKFDGELQNPNSDPIKFLEHFRSFSEGLIYAGGTSTNTFASLLGTIEEIVSKLKSDEPIEASMLAREMVQNIRQGAPVSYGDRVYDDLIFRPALNNLDINGKTVHLTPSESVLLRCLTDHPGEVRLHADIEEYCQVFLGQAVKKNVQHLRTKLNESGRAPKFILSHRGLGYQFTGIPRES